MFQGYIARKKCVHWQIYSIIFNQIFCPNFTRLSISACGLLYGPFTLKAICQEFFISESSSKRSYMSIKISCMICNTVFNQHEKRVGWSEIRTQTFPVGLNSSMGRAADRNPEGVSSNLASNGGSESRRCEARFRVLVKKRFTWICGLAEYGMRKVENAESWKCGKLKMLRR